MTRHEGTKGEWVYSTTLSLTLAQDEVGGQQDLVTLPPEKTQCLLYRRLVKPHSVGLDRPRNPTAV